jgi:hypothetical protein
VRRSYEQELMDLRGNEPDMLAEDLCNLRLLNRYFCGRRCVMLGLHRALDRQKLKHFSLLDIGTGSADIPAAILTWANNSVRYARVAQAAQSVWNDLNCWKGWGSDEISRPVLAP